jgi:trk system potassium uptake protein TrkH
MSGFTTTGASVFAQIDGLPRSILLWRSITHWLGGMGIIGLTLAMMPIAGTGGFQMYSAESPGMTHEKITPRLQQTALCLWGVYAGLTAALTLMLALGGMSFFDAVNHSMATMATGGFSTRSASVAYYGSPYIEWVLAIFMFLAGANFVLHFYALRGRSLRHYFADPEFRFYAVSVSALSLMVAADLFLARGGSFAGALRTAAFHVTSMVTTTGFVADDYELWPHFSRGIIFICLFLGGCAGSTAGGIKHVRLLAMWNAVALRAKQPLNPRAVVAVPVGATALDPAVMSSCMAFLGLYFIVFIAGAFAASLFEPDFVTALSGAATTLGNVGPAFGGLGATDNFSGQAAPAKWVYSFLMLCGRLELYTVFALIGEIFRRVRRDSIMAGGVND